MKSPTETGPAANGTVLHSLRFASFRNLTDGSVELSPGLNVISGDNGHGKTNLLEACLFLAMGRSFRASGVDALVRRQEPLFALDGVVSHHQVRHRIEVKAGRGVRQRTLDGRAADLGETLAVMACMVFATPRLTVFRGGPDDRRRFLDRGIVGIRPDMVARYRDYLRALRQKNHLLRQARQGAGISGLREQLAAFNIHLAGAARVIRRQRQDYVSRLSRIMGAAGGPGELVPGGQPQMTYRPHPPLESGADASEADLLAAYEARADDEIRRGHALVGPQRDDFLLSQEAGDMTRFSSAGQQRATLIALKMAKMLLQKEITGSYPLFLVDDVDAELDAERTRRALALLSGPYQVLVASAAAHAWAADSSVARHLRVQNGIIRSYS